MAIERFGGPDELRLVELPRPAVAAGEVLIRIVAAGIDPLDGEIREGRLRELLPHAFPLVPGWEAAGLVEELGVGVARLRRGERVWAFARKPVVQHGCYAEYVTVPEVRVARMPARLLYEEAAALIVPGLLALEGKGAGPDGLGARGLDSRCEQLEALTREVEAGRLAPGSYRILALSRAPEAHRRLGAPDCREKLVLNL